MFMLFIGMALPACVREKTPMKSIHSILVSIFLAGAALPSHAQTLINTIPSRILGQAVLQRLTVTATAPNLLEGRELNSPQAVALDTSVSPPILYVADSFNSRVLAWKSATTALNGAFADLVLGQPDNYSSSPQSATGNFSRGLAFPTALAVDSKGNLYVADAGNNRILRFPKPFSQTNGYTPDLVLGQPGLTTASSNQGQTSPGPNTLALFASNGPFQAGMAFDAAGNLWVTDAGNNRVLRFNAAVLPAGAANDPNADLVLGEPVFTTNAIPPNSNSTKKNFLAAPGFLAFDPAGNLYVSDSAIRVLVFTTPFYAGESASRIMGVDPPTPTNPKPAPISANTLGAANFPPQGIFFIGSNPFVCDPGNNRILGYPPFSQWPPETTRFGPTANFVFSQPDFASSKLNSGNPQPSASTLSSPAGAFTNGTDLFIADAGNNRVLDFPISGGTFTAASRVFGQVDFPYNSVNLIEGREFYFFAGNQNVSGVNFAFPGGSAVIDPKSNPPHLYVSDAGNNRVLGFNDYRQIVAGQKADLVIGQPDFFNALVNYPSNKATTPTASSLYSPEGLAVDSNGNLWVADSGNGRILRFPQPFKQSTGTVQTATVVLGQAYFNQVVTDPTASTMRSPYGLALTQEGDLLASDQFHNRILFFHKPQGGDFSNGQLASAVIGQPDFTSVIGNNPSAGSGGLAGPHMIATDSGDQLYVADTGNSRIAIFRDIPTAGTNPTVSIGIQGLNQPTGVAVNPTTGEIWVANTLANNVIRFPNYDQILIGNGTPTETIAEFEPLSVALDTAGNPIIPDADNRVSFFYPALGLGNTNAANYFHRYAPGMLDSLFGTFAKNSGAAASLPLPTSMADVQVLVNGIAAPLLYVSPTQINFQIPMATPTGPQDFEVLQISTNQILSDGLYSVEQSSPGFFSLDRSGTGPLAAVNNDDGKPNSSTDPVKAGHFISLFGTGQGVVNGAPPDGYPATGAVPTSQQPQVYAGGTDFLPPSAVQYSGLAPGFVGLWQINIQIPSNAAPGATTVVVLFKGNPSNQDAAGEHLATPTTIYIGQ